MKRLQRTHLAHCTSVGPLPASLTRQRESLRTELHVANHAPLGARLSLRVTVRPTWSKRG